MRFLRVLRRFPVTFSGLVLLRFSNRFSLFLGLLDPQKTLFSCSKTTFFQIFEPFENTENTHNLYINLPLSLSNFLMKNNLFSTLNLASDLGWNFKDFGVKNGREILMFWHNFGSFFATFPECRFWDGFGSPFGSLLAPFGSRMAPF